MRKNERVAWDNTRERKEEVSRAVRRVKNRRYGEIPGLVKPVETPSLLDHLRTIRRSNPTVKVEEKYGMPVSMMTKPLYDWLVRARV